MSAVFVMHLLISGVRLFVRVYTYKLRYYKSGCINSKHINTGPQLVFFSHALLLHSLNRFRGRLATWLKGNDGIFQVQTDRLALKLKNHFLCYVPAILL